MPNRRLKSKEESKAVKKLLKAMPYLDRLEAGQRGVMLEEERQFRKFVRAMRKLPYLKSVEASQREALLMDLHRLANLKKGIERRTSDDRTEAEQFREYRSALANVERRRLTRLGVCV